MDIVLITNLKRPKLLDQTLRSMRDNAVNWDQHALAVVIDAVLLDDPAYKRPFPHWLAYSGGGRGVGACKNYGAQMLKDLHDAELPPDGLLLHADDDQFFLPGWDDKAERAIHHSGMTQLGLWSHPYNKVTQKHPLASDWSIEVGMVDAAAGSSQVWRWKDWLKYGPFPDNAVGVGQSEDWALSQRVMAMGGRVGCVYPYLVINCGITNSEGNPSPGADAMRELAEQQIMDDGLEGKVVLE